MSCPLGERSRCVWSEAFPWWQTEFYNKETIRDVWVFLAIQLGERERQTKHTHTERVVLQIIRGDSPNLNTGREIAFIPNMSTDAAKEAGKGTE